MTAASNSDARKREAERAERAARDAQRIAQAPASPSVAPGATDDANGAQIANLTSEQREALAELALLYGTYIIGRWAQVIASDDEPDDNWQETAAQEAVDLFAPGAAEMIAAIVREHRAEVLAEVERVVAGRREAFLASPNLDPVWIAGWHSAVDDVTNSVRDCRQEQNHA